MEKKKLLIFGTGLFAEVAYYYLTKDSDYEIVAFVVDKENIDTREKFGLPVVSFDCVERQYPPSRFNMFIAIAYRGLNTVRAKKYREAKEKGYVLISYVCTKAIVWDNVKLGDNCFVFEANVIQPFVQIGNDVIIWSGNHIGHHAVIEDHCFIASHAVISGNVKIKAYCFLGVNASIRDGVTIARGCTIGANALIVKDTCERGVYGGPPAALLRVTDDPGVHDRQ